MALQGESRQEASDPPIGVWRVHDAIATSFGAVLDSSGELLPALSFDLPGARSPADWLNGSPAFDLRHAILLPRITCFTGTVVAIVSSPNYQANYYHWLLDMIPRILIAEWAGYGDALFFVDSSQSFQAQSLLHLGYGSTQLISARENRFLKAGTVIVPDFPDSFARLQDWVVPAVRGRLMGTQPRGQRSDASLLLYLRRRIEGRRRLANEGDVLPALTALGFDTVDPGAMSFDDQLALFSRARLIVGVHGAGLANLLFVPAGSSVVEILTPGFHALTYRDLARAAGVHYHGLVGEGEQEPNPNWDHQGDDVRVDPRALLTTVEGILRGGSH